MRNKKLILFEVIEKAVAGQSRERKRIKCLRSQSIMNVTR